MDLVCQWFQNNLDIVFFVYGLSFVVMGLAISFQPKKESEFSIAKILWLLAFFGITHGINEWLDMWAIIRGQNRGLDLVRWFALVISYFFLFEFGRRIFRITSSKCPSWRKQIAKPFGWWLSPIIGIFILIAGFTSFDFWKTGSTWARYLLGFPGCVLTGLGFLSYYRCEKEKLEPLKVKAHFLLAGLAFLIYGTLSGLIVPKGDFFPANWLNTDSFLLTVKIPVQVFRAFCAIVSAVTVSGILKVFHYEQMAKIQNALAEREKITEGIQDGIFLVDKNFKVIWANNKEKDAYGDIIGDFCYHATHKRDSVCQPPQDPCPLVEVLKTGKPQTLIHTHFAQSGEPLYVEVSAYPIRDEQGNIVKFVHLSRNITEKMKLEETIKSIGDPLIVINSKGRITVANPLALELAGYIEEKELVGKHAGIIFAEEEEEEEEEEELLQHIGLGILSKNGSIQNYETEIFTKGRTQKIPVSVTASLVKYQNRILGIVCVLRDLREIKQLQLQLIHQGRLASVGELAAGLAHEIGNPLQTILGNTELLLMETKNEELEAIKNASLHCKKIIEGLLDFSRQQEMNFVPEDINKLLEKTLSLYGKQLELKKIKVEKKFGELPKITVSPSHIEQVFLNMITNARKAMPKGGTLTITTSCHAELDSASLKIPKQVRDDNFVVISFKDTGIGIPKENISKLFEPFFTTGKDGSGLGLSISYGIVKQHGGEIYVFSDGENKGAEFVVKLSTRGGGKTV